MLARQYACETVCSRDSFGCRANSWLTRRDSATHRRWLTAPNPAVWEPTPCVVVNDDGSYSKVSCDEL